MACAALAQTTGAAAFDLDEKLDAASAQTPDGGIHYAAELQPKDGKSAASAETVARFDGVVGKGVKVRVAASVVDMVSGSTTFLVSAPILVGSPSE